MTLAALSLDTDLSGGLSMSAPSSATQGDNKVAAAQEPSETESSVPSANSLGAQSNGRKRKDHKRSRKVGELRTIKHLIFQITFLSTTNETAMAPPETPYEPYASVHKDINGPGDARPSWIQVLKDCDAIGKLKGKNVLISKFPRVTTILGYMCYCTTHSEIFANCVLLLGQPAAQLDSAWKPQRRCMRLVLQFS